MSDVFDDLIDRQSPPNDPARIADVIASDRRFAYFGTAAFAVRLLRLDQKIVSGVPMSLKRVANVLNTKPELLQQFCDGFSRYGDRTLTLFADGQAIEPCSGVTAGETISSKLNCDATWNNAPVFSGDRCICRTSPVTTLTLSRPGSPPVDSTLSRRDCNDTNSRSPMP
jgi:hypothetical protein